MIKSGLKFQTRSAFYMALRLAFLVLIVFGMINVLRTGTVPGDFLFFVLVALAWVVTTVLVGYGTRRLHWSDSWYDLLIVCMDVYFLVLALSLADGAAGAALLGMALYGFTVAVISSPLASLLAGVSGLAAYLTSFVLGGVMPRPGMPLVLTVVGAAVVCGTAWRLCLPLILKALYFYLENKDIAIASAMPPPSAAAEPEPAAAPDAAADADLAPVDAELLKQLEAKDQAFAELRVEKEKLAAELIKTNEELMKLFENSGGPAEAGGGDDALRQQLAEKDKALAALQADKDRLEAELAKTNEELMKLFENSGTPAPAPAAPGGGDEELRKQLAQKEAELAAVRVEKEKLQVELDKTNEELTRMFRV